jgi:hypothetical protein
MLGLPEAVLMLSPFTTVTDELSRGPARLDEVAKDVRHAPAEARFAPTAAAPVRLTPAVLSIAPLQHSPRRVDFRANRPVSIGSCPHERSEDVRAEEITVNNDDEGVVGHLSPKLGRALVFARLVRTKSSCCEQMTSQ